MEIGSCLDIAAIIAIVAAIVQVMRKIKWLDERTSLLPLLSIAVGLIVVGGWVLLVPPAASVRATVGYWLLTGILAGLSASGLYDLAGKKIFETLGALLKR